MISNINISSSALHASQKKLSVTANNIANIYSRSVNPDNGVQNGDFIPKHVVQTSLGNNGGVKATVKSIEPPSIAINSNDGELHYIANVNMIQEMVQNRLEAKHSYQVNLKMIKMHDDLQKTLIDILS